MAVEKVRIDKWLWSVRIFKTRTMATDAVKSGKVKVNGKVVKPALSLQRGDQVMVQKSGFTFEFLVVDLIEKRVGAPIAQLCYQDLTSPDELNKYKNWYVGKSTTERRERGAGRPTKRERREIDEFKENWLEFDDLE